MNSRLLSLLGVLVLGGASCGYGTSHLSSGPGDQLTSGTSGMARVSFFWSFAGRSCAQSSVQTVVVDMPGELLENGGRYACSNGNRDGITLDAFIPGTYPFTVSGYDATGALRYQTSGQVVVDGSDQFEVVDLSPTDNQGPSGGSPDAGSSDCTDAGSDGGATPPGGELVDGGAQPPPGGTTSGEEDGGFHDDGGAGVDAGGFPEAPDAGTYDAGSPDAGHESVDAGIATDAGSGGGSCGCGHPDAGTDAGTALSSVSWTFPVALNAPTCGDELAQVVLTIDGQLVSAHECGAGLFPSRVALPELTPGSHSLEIDAIDATGMPWASTQVGIDIPSGDSTYEIYPVPWIVGSAALSWTFYSCDGLQTYGTCDEAGVDTVAVNFQDALGRWLYADAHGYPLDDQQSCSATNGLTVLRAVTPGAYTAFVAGYGPRGSGLIYSEYPDQASYPITVKAGVFLGTGSPLSSFVPVRLYQQP